MWATISKILINIIIAIISDKASVEIGKRLLTKAVDSSIEGVGITNEDAKEIIHKIADSALNTVTKDVVSRVGL